MLLSVVCTSQYKNLYINGYKTVYEKTEFFSMKTISENCSVNYFYCWKLFMLLKTVLKTISAAENCFNGG